MHKTDSKAPILVLGAGCAGLAAGIRLAEQGIPVCLIEKEDHVGGLAGGLRHNNNVYEYGPHIFHTTDQELMETMRHLMGSDLLEYHRTIQIKFMDQYFPFPLTLVDVIKKLPFSTLARAFASFLIHTARGALPGRPPETSETILQRQNGQVLYEIFFKTYIERVWGMSPAQMSPAFARERIPRLNVFEEAEKLFSRMKRRLQPAGQTEGYVEKVEGPLYTTRHGFSLIVQRLADQLMGLGGRILLSSEVTQLHRTGDRVSEVAYVQESRIHQIHCRGIINTLPINEITQLFSPAFDSQTLTAADSLQFRALVFVAFLVNRPRVLPASLMYFRQHAFNRISDSSYFGFEVKPPGSTLVVTEMTCSPKDLDHLIKPDIVESATAELEKEKLLNRADILDTFVYTAPHAYPVYTLGYEVALKTVFEAWASLSNAETAGRQGRFQYVNSHIVLKMGKQAADRLMSRLTNPAEGQGPRNSMKDALAG